MRKTKSLLLLTIVFIFCSGRSFAQEGKPVYGDPMQDVTIVGACTIGGAILGLSTLPFTEEPGDHLKNIVVGGAIGLIVGVAVVAYNQANVTQSSYSLYKTPESPKEFFGHTRVSELNLLKDEKVEDLRVKEPPQFQVSFNF